MCLDSLVLELELGSGRYLTAPYIRVPLLLGFFADRERVSLLREPLLQAQSAMMREVCVHSLCFLNLLRNLTSCAPTCCLANLAPSVAETNFWKMQAVLDAALFEPGQWQSKEAELDGA